MFFRFFIRNAKLHRSPNDDRQQQREKKSKLKNRQESSFFYRYFAFI